MSNVTAWEVDEYTAIDADASRQDWKPSPTDSQLDAQRKLAAVINPEMAPVVPKIKYYLGFENERNARNGDLFTNLIKIAFGSDEVVIPGHHFMFDTAADMDRHDLSKVNEIPSADTLIFDHYVMTRVFGDKAVAVMADLACRPVDSRDDVLRAYFSALTKV
jgi:hypothetical protein